MYFGGGHDYDHHQNQRQIRENANKPGSGASYKSAPFMLLMFFAILLGFAAVLLIAAQFLPMMLDGG